MKNQKLTETQIKLLSPLLQEYNQTKSNLETAILFIVGKDIKTFNILESEITYEEIEKPEEIKKESFSKKIKDKIAKIEKEKVKK